MNNAKELPRDVFIDVVLEELPRNPNLYFISADLGAKALDRFRVEAKKQFIHAGISEQNMIDVAAGLALEGKLVYVYAMAPFVTLRCYEQIKVALASMRLPVTIIGVGVGYSYDDAGPTHYATEDISCMRALGGIEILTPSDTRSVAETARLTFSRPGLRYIRLDRTFLPDVYGEGDRRFLDEGIVEIEKGKEVCIVTSGFMVQKARAVRDRLLETGIAAGVVDLFCLKPIRLDAFRAALESYDRLVTVEEHFLSGGMGSAVLEALADAGMQKKVLRLGVQDQYYFENGGRQHLHKLADLDVESIANRIRKFL